MVSLTNCTKRYPDHLVFKDLNLSFPEEKITVILGPSGCGKTTLLNILSGADKNHGGSLSTAKDFSVGYLFQEPRLLPWKTVRGNLEFVLPSSLTAAETAEIIDEHLGLVDLSDFADYYPRDLSGGMRQRAAMARAFSYPATTILMDEPFQGLDLNLKLKLTRALLNLWEREQRTIIFVTHAIQEAVLLGDKIIVLSGPPAVKLREITVPVHQQNRTLDNPEISEIERELYSVITKN